MMQWYEILVIVFAIAFVVGVTTWQIVKRKKGKGCCDCSSGCTSCPHCKTQKSDKAMSEGKKSNESQKPLSEEELRT